MYGSPRFIVPIVLTIMMSSAGFLRAQEVELLAPCTAPVEVNWLGQSLPRLANRLARSEAVTIVAVGSSSTAGAGASSPAQSYPSQLQEELRTRFPGRAITVLNRGVNGEEAAEMLARFDAGVIAAKPDLVLWQVATNAVLRDHAVDEQAPLIREGIRRLKAGGADVVIVNPQFAPKVIEKFDVLRMVDLVGSTAKSEGAGLFHRFALMRYWIEAERMGFEEFLSPDGLHMNDWSYACVAKVLAGAIEDAAKRAGVNSDLSVVRKQ